VRGVLVTLQGEVFREERREEMDQLTLIMVRRRRRH